MSGREAFALPPPATVGLSPPLLLVQASISSLHTGCLSGDSTSRSLAVSSLHGALDYGTGALEPDSTSATASVSL